MRSIVLLQFMCQPSYRLQPNSRRLMVNLPTKTKSELNTRRSFLEVKLEDGDRSPFPRRKVLNFSLEREINTIDLQFDDCSPKTYCFSASPYAQHSTYTDSDLLMKNICECLAGG